MAYGKKTGQPFDTYLQNKFQYETSDIDSINNNSNSSSALDTVNLTSKSKSYDLPDLLVSSKRNLTKLIPGGFSYDISHNKEAQQENLYDALSYVPFIKTSIDGITVYGSNSYTIYVNGRPYDFSESNPIEILKSISASKISKIEIIDDVTEKYGVPSKPIINIITSHKIFEGITLNLGGLISTKPDGSGNVFAIGSLQNVDMAASYSYNLTGQRDQRIFSDYHYYPNTDSSFDVKSQGDGNGNWNTHILRFMIKWRIDSLNSLYADTHGKLNHNTSDNTWCQEYAKSHLNNIFDRLNYTLKQKENSGAIESNVVYRNYFRHNPQKQRLAIGYRFSYTPDKRYYNYYIDNESFRQGKTGGLNEHSVKGICSFIIDNRQNLNFEVEEIIRNGKTYTFSERDIEENGISLKYNQLVSHIDLSYTAVLKNMSFGAWLIGEYCKTDAKLPFSPTSNYNRNEWNFTPNLSLSWILSHRMSIRFYYASSTTRPSISQLNPYRVNLNNNLSSEGNPNLKTMQTNKIFASIFNNFGNFSLKASVDFAICSKAILQYEYMDGDTKVATYGNIGNHST